MKKFFYILFIIFIYSINGYSQDKENLNLIKGEYEDEIFVIIDSIGEFYIYEKQSGISIVDGQEYKSNSFTVEVLKTLKPSKSASNIPQVKYTFSNEDGETLIIHEFMDDTQDKITNIYAMPPCVDFSKSEEKRHTCFYLKDRYFVYFYNVKAENNFKMFNSIQSIKPKD